MTNQPTFHPGSFRDPEGRVFSANGRIFRTLSPAAAKRMRTFERDGRLQTLIDSKAIIPSTLTTATQAGLDPNLCGDFVMEHEPIPLVTYPYEWSFDMLRDAALKTLDLLEHCLDMEIILKDATPFNLSVHKNSMIFMDTLSLDDYRDGQPWEGYSQFCREFLFPLMLTSYKKLEFQPWLRGTLNGLNAPDLSRILGYGGVPCKGVWMHVHLQALLERYVIRRKDVVVRNRFTARTFSKKIAIQMIRKLRRLVGAMPYRPLDSTWEHYESQHTYDPQDERMKETFIAEAVQTLPGDLWVDVGCNNGKYALIAAQGGKSVAGLDADPSAVNGYYRRIRDQSGASCYPVVLNLLNPSPAMGWRLAERPAFFERLKADNFLALALVHHLCIGGNVPLGAFIEMLKDCGRAGVVEWVDKKDAMVQRLLRNRVDIFPDYTREHFRTCLEKHFEIVGVQEIHEGSRSLFLVTKRADS